MQQNVFSKDCVYHPCPINSLANIVPTYCLASPSKRYERGAARSSRRIKTVAKLRIQRTKGASTARMGSLSEHLGKGGVYLMAPARPISKTSIGRTAVKLIAGVRVPACYLWQVKTVLCIYSLMMQFRVTISTSNVSAVVGMLIQ